MCAPSVSSAFTSTWVADIYHRPLPSLEGTRKKKAPSLVLEIEIGIDNTNSRVPSQTRNLATGKEPHQRAHPSPPTPPALRPDARH